MDGILDQEQELLLKQTRDVLGQLRDVLNEAAVQGEDKAALVESIRQLDELFLLVVSGEFNSGKSSFINALIGQTLLQEGVTPTTSHIHLLRYGEQVAQSPREKGVWVHTAPVELLRNINIVDTPGTNAILREHEALTAEFIPRSDLVLFLTSADRPFTESERTFLNRIRSWGKKIVLVVNKVDILGNEEELKAVMAFVEGAARQLVGDVAAIFGVSARLAQQAKAGKPQLWQRSGFEQLENYVSSTLDDSGRFRLKLLNPLGVGAKLVGQQLNFVQEDLQALKKDSDLLNDIQQQMSYYNEDMQRNFKARLGEIDNILFAMERRGNEFFEEMIRLSRIPDLIRANQVQKAFEERVVADTPKQIERRVAELVDWLVEQDLRQWTAVAEHLAQRQDNYQERIVGQGGRREGTLAYDRQRLVDSMGEATNRAVESYDKEAEANQLAEGVRAAVVNTGLAGVGVGLGVAIAVAAHVVWVDVTGILAGVVAATFGLLILPARRRKARQELGEKLEQLRLRLMNSLTEQFEREMRRSSQRVADTIAPFDRFVRAESHKLTTQQASLVALEAHIVGLQRQVGGE